MRAQRIPGIINSFYFRMGSRKYYVIFHAISCGMNGGALGSDEQDIVLIVYLVLDIINNKVCNVYMLLLLK